MTRRIRRQPDGSQSIINLTEGTQLLSVYLSVDYTRPASRGLRVAKESCLHSKNCFHLIGFLGTLSCDGIPSRVLELRRFRPGRSKVEQ